jgi:hypothetical protein
MIDESHTSKRKKPPEGSSCFKAFENGKNHIGCTYVATSRILQSFNSVTGFSKRREYQLTIPGPCHMQE